MDDRVSAKNSTLILGGGLAGLSAAHKLSEARTPVTVVEADRCVGGLARTVEHNGFRFDLGGHRFVTQDKALEQFVRELLGKDFLVVPRSSKILLRNRYFDYPLKPVKTFFGFGPVTSVRILLDYFLEQIRSRIVTREPVSLEDWVVMNYGRTMFNIYFRDYSEKVWGVDCQQIDQKWVEQRIQGLSLGKAIAKALMPKNKKQYTTLADQFLYPRLGIGEIADKLADDVREQNAIFTNTRVEVINHSNSEIESVQVSCNNQHEEISAKHFISTIPLPVLVKLFNPGPPKDVIEAANQLRSRDLVTVTLMINQPRVTEDTWIYVPEKSIPFGRIHEPTNWSDSMAPPGKSLLVIEYFCFRGDKTWSTEDEELIARTSNSLAELGILKQADIMDGVVLRIPNAYPLFNVGYADHCQTIYRYLSTFENLYTAGRGGMFKYYNMDHTMLAGFDVARSVLQKQEKALEAVELSDTTGRAI